MIGVGEVLNALVHHVDEGKAFLVFQEVAKIHADIEQEWSVATKPSEQADNNLRRIERYSNYFKYGK